MIQIGVIGCGHWGPNHIRVFSFLRDARVLSVADPDAQRLQYIQEQYPQIAVHETYAPLLDDPGLDAIVVATPTHTHYELVKAALLAGKHVLCEKPLCQTVAEGAELVALAQRQQRTLMVGHIFLFNPGILKLKELIRAKHLGAVYYLAATRTNLGPIRNDVNVAYDLATHDIAIFDFLLDSPPLSVSAVGAAFLQPGIQDVAFITLTYPQGVIANIQTSWLDPRKVRQMTIVGDQRMATWDDLAPIGPVTIYDKGVDKEPYYNCFGEFQLLSREGDVIIPKIRMQEPLKAQNQHFLACIRNTETPVSDGQTGVTLVKILAAIQHSLETGGHPVSLAD